MKHAASTSNLPHYGDGLGLDYLNGDSYNLYSSNPSAYLDNQLSYMQYGPSNPNTKLGFEIPMSLPGQDQSALSQSNRDKGAELYKTELCRKWMTTGSCRYGAKCQFAHGEAELRTLMRHPLYKTSMCKSYQATGACRYGSRCRFIHDETDQELSGLPRSNSTANISYQSLSIPNRLLRAENAFPRVPSAPDNLGMHIPTAQSLLAHSDNIDIPENLDWSTVHRQRTSTLPKNYSQSHLKFDGVHPEVFASSNAPLRGVQPRMYVQGTNGRAMPTSFSTNDLSFARSRLNHSFSEDHGLFPSHLVDCRDMPVAGSTESPYSSAASSADSHSTAYSSASSSLGLRFSLEHSAVDQEDEMEKLSTEVAQRLLKSQSQPVFTHTLAEAIPEEYVFENKNVDELSHNFDSFHIADLSDVERTELRTFAASKLNAGITSTIKKRKNVGMLRTHLGNLGSSTPANPSFSDASFKLETKDSDSRLDFFRSISNHDLLGLSKASS